MAIIEHQGVDGEIPPGGGRLRGDLGIEFDGKTAMTGGDLGIPAREREIVSFTRRNG